jgi:hypothetical protein
MSAGSGTRRTTLATTGKVTWPRVSFVVVDRESGISSFAAQAEDALNVEPSLSGPLPGGMHTGTQKRSSKSPTQRSASDQDVGAPTPWVVLTPFFALCYFPQPSFNNN